MSGRIRAIREAEWRDRGICHRWGEHRYQGYEIETDSETIRIGIDSEQGCCERFGYLCSEDEPAKFVGASLLRIDRVTRDTERDAVLVREVMRDYGLDGGGALFVNVVTDRGTFQIVAYNEHNGYYGHEAVLIGHGYRHGEVL